MAYVRNFVLSMLFLAIDLAATVVTNTYHLQEQNEEDIANIVMISVHGLIILSNFAMIFVSVSRTIKYKAGLFGELMRLTLWPLVHNFLHMGLMPMPWVYRRWILKKRIYWDDTTYLVMTTAHIFFIFCTIYATFALHCRLTFEDNYDSRMHPKLLTRPPMWLVGVTGKARGITASQSRG
eukprot:Sspe_Gene.60354::Locus_33259_Transcript_2_2_Confidence_0.500_Length_589::g.60354::m.60354